MLIDITYPITPELAAKDPSNTNKALAGHLGTHFDVMDKTFPLEYTQRKGIVFDVSAVDGRDITADDIDLSRIEKDMFVIFYTGYIEKVPYATGSYFKEHPQLSYALIDALLSKGVSVIGLDFGGVRRAPEHVPTDQRCADHGVFVVENLCNLKTLLEKGCPFSVYTFPMNYTGITGLPCRVIAEI